MADAAKSGLLKEQGEMHSIGVNHAVALALFAGMSIVVRTFGDQ